MIIINLDTQLQTDVNSVLRYSVNVYSCILRQSFAREQSIRPSDEPNGLK